MSERVIERHPSALHAHGCYVTSMSKKENLCRFCGKTASSKKTSAKPKEKFKLEFQRHGIAIEEDNDFIHPSNVCLTCVGVFLSPEMANRQMH